MSQTSASAPIEDLVKTVNLTGASSLVSSATRDTTFLGKAKGLIMRVFKYVLTLKNWKKSPKLWIGALIFLRFALLFLREYGLTLFKKDITGWHVYLTGAGSGIGRGMALKLGAMGCKLSISDINLAGVEETKKLLIDQGVPAENINVMQVDVSKRTSISESAQAARAKFGPVSLLINNAGVVSGKQTLDLSEAMIERTMYVNTISHMFTIREFLPDMIEQKKGHIVSIASMAGLAGIPALPDYCASKWGAVAIDESVRGELKKNGHWGYIKTTCICPYFINTGMFDGARRSFPMYILSPDEVEKRIINAIRQEEAQVTIPYRGNLTFIAKLLPISWYDSVASILGISSAMDDFKGRGSMESRIPGLSN